MKKSLSVAFLFVVLGLFSSRIAIAGFWDVVKPDFKNGACLALTGCPGFTELKVAMYNGKSVLRDRLGIDDLDSCKDKTQQVINHFPILDSLESGMAKLYAVCACRAVYGD